MTHEHSSKDRRRHPRHQLRRGLAAELRVEVSGDKPAILLTRGNVADISCGGLKCDIDFDVPVGTRIDVCFPSSAAAFDMFDGRVVRTESLGGVPDRVAIAFARPLETIELDRLRPAETVPSTNGRQATSWADERHALPTFATGSPL